MKEAAAEFEKVLKLDPKFDVGIYMLLASAYQATGESGSAIAALEGGLQRKPKDPKMLRALAYIQFHTKNDADAMRTLQQLLEIDPADLASRMDLALLFQRGGDLENAIRTLRLATDLAK